MAALTHEYTVLLRILRITLIDSLPCITPSVLNVSGTCEYDEISLQDYIALYGKRKLSTSS